MKAKDLLNILSSLSPEELEQDVEVHDDVNGKWHFDVVVTPNHDGVLEISVNR